MVRQMISPLLLAVCAAPGLAAPIVLFDEAAPQEAHAVDVMGCSEAAVSLRRAGEGGAPEPAVGEWLLALSGVATPAPDGATSRAYVRIWTGRQTVAEGMRLSYCLYIDPGSVSYGFATDLAVPNFYPDNLRDRPEAVDQAGIRAHPGKGFTADYAVGQWYYREIDLSALAGREIEAAYVAWDGAGPLEGEFAGYFDRIMLWQAGDEEAEALAAEAQARCLDPALRDLSGYGEPITLGEPRALRREIPAPETDDSLVTVGPNGYFRFADGRAFLPWGLFGSEIYTGLGEGGVTGPGPWWSHVPWEGPNSEPVEIAEEDWTSYFAECRRRDISSLRLFTYGHTTDVNGSSYYFPLDAVGKVHPVLWAKLDRFMEVGYEHGIRFLFTLIASPDWLPYVRHSRSWAPPNQVLSEAQRQYGEDELEALEPFRRRFIVDGGTVEIGDAYDNDAVFGDPDIALCIEAYLRDLLPRLAADRRVFALEIMNEAFPTQHVEWAEAHVVRLCRELAPGRPVTISHTLGSGVQTLDSAEFVERAGLDVYNWHSYLPQNECLTLELAANCLFYNAPVPGFPTEGPAYYGGWEADDVDERQRRLAIRDYLWLPLVTGCPGSILWAPESPGIAPSEWDELERFHRVLAEVTSSLDFGALRREPATVAISLDLPLPLRRVATNRCLRRGVPVVFSPADHDTGARLVIREPGDLALIGSQPTPVRAWGCDAAPYLATEGFEDVLIYVPNLVRGRRGLDERAVELILDLPGEGYEVRCYAVEAQTCAEAVVPARCRLTLSPSTADDWFVWLRRR